MSKNRNTNKVRKALKRKRNRLWHGARPTRSQFGRGAGGYNAHKQAVAAWEQVHKNFPTDPNKPPPSNDPPDAGTPGGPDPEPVDPRVGEVTVEKKDGEAPNVQIKRGETFTPKEATVDKVDSTKEEDQLGLVQMKKATAVPRKQIKAAKYKAKDYTAKTADTPEDYETDTFNAAQSEGLDPTKAAQSAVDRVAEAEGPTQTERALAADRDRISEQEALAQRQVFTQDQRSMVDKVTGQTVTVSPTPEAEAQQREAILGEPAPDGEAAQILSLYNFDKSQQREVRGAEAKAKVLNDLKAEGVPDDVAEQLASDPERLAQAADSLDDGIKTRLSGLSKEALVSTQMESLLAGMEEGETPAWARPALAAVEANLAKRGLDVSTVGRDSLFNAIIQSAIPLAQSNAQAIQAATSQDKTIAGQFLIKNAEFKQQMELANLSNDQQMRLANLTALNQADAQNLNARQQTELANLQTKLTTNIKSAEIAASMNQAQLSVDQQRAVTNAMTVARIDMSRFNADQQVELTNSKFMQTNTLTDFSARQQEAMQNATILAQMDLATADQDMKLAIENARNFLTMNMQNLSNEQQTNIFDQQMRQQTMLTNTAAENAARQFNAASENQKNQFMTNLQANMNQFNASSINQSRQFNAAEENKARAINAQNTQQARLAQAQLNTQIQQFNSQQEFNRNQWNAANEQAVMQSNVEWRRKANLVNTAAQNAANQQAASFQFNIDSSEQAFLWQNLRDEAAYLRQAYENEEQRKTTLYATALGNETAADKGNVGTGTIKGWVDNIFA